MLEVIDKGGCTDAHPVPLLFVHGAWHAAWCWDEYFLDHFADKGYRALAVSLRGHGTSTTDKPLRRCSLFDYIDDVLTVADALPNSPVLVGHSMGGFIVQKCLELGDFPAGVLLASAPKRGAFAYAVRLFRRFPLLLARSALTGDSRAPVRGPVRTRAHFFSEQVSDADVARYSARLDDESARVGVDAMLRLPRRKRVTAPLLVLGADGDASVLPRWVHATARGYRTGALMFAGMGHDMMLEPGWHLVADTIDEWLSSHKL